MKIIHRGITIMYFTIFLIICKILINSVTDVLELRHLKHTKSNAFYLI